MNQFEFDILLKKYLAGEHSPAEEKFVQEYLDNNPFDESPVFEFEKEKIGNRIRKQLNKSTGNERFLIPFSSWLKGMAASLILVAGCWFGFQYVSKKEISEIQTIENEGVIEIKNTSNSPQRIPLEDGSIVILQKKSSLSYPEHFGETKRLVYLHGEAFFQIKKNPAKPFIVSTENLVTQVLGTSFTVKSYDEARSIEVQVATGRVSVYEVAEKASTSSNGVILTRNQKIVFDKKSKKMELAIVSNPILNQTAIPADRGFSFLETPVKDAFLMLEKAYGIDIVIENDAVESCLFTGDLTDLTLFEQLDLICKSVNATYERRGTTLFVRGEGCPK
ncbi:FecR family protein [Dyadobacter koreensis]|uniref:FecR family protein n=1 Tax=Dyadobacter koreensis TaxID=408657 RepID=A0A1H7AKS0_9BACT|nr:FecR family protein [Dyadobacter koreensis]SEJ64477.1 FecR family protein [Dyadobacter koreensis]